MRKFTTCSSSLKDKVNLAEGAEDTSQPQDVFDETLAKTTLGGAAPSKLSEQKILGVCWDVHSDTFIFNLNKLADLAAQTEPTKRNVISIVGRFYDPLGVLSSLIISFKILMQEICEPQINWDQLMEEAQLPPPISIPRGHFSNIEGPVDSNCLYRFCDTSKKAYAPVIYLVTRTPVRTHV